MRKSKSVPARYTRNYKSISQRQMTAFDGLDEDAEMKRLRNLIRDSKSHIDAATEAVENMPSRKRKRAVETKKDSASGLNSLNEDDSGGKKQEATGNEILSKELAAEMGAGDDVVITTKKKKKKPKKNIVELTPQEIRQAKLTHKKAEKKLKQLEQRKEAKQKRAQLYEKLQNSAISKQEMDLLSSSSTLGKKVTKRDKLKRSLQRERAGIKLTEEEHDLLYQDRDAPDYQTTPRNHQEETLFNDKPKEEETNKKDNKLIQQQKEDIIEDSTNAEAIQKPVSFASQMMASLTKLKSKGELMSAEAEKERNEEKKMKEEEDHQKQLPSKKRYVPVETAVLKSAATLGITPAEVVGMKKVLKIERPNDVKASRYALPVAEMEFEVMDTVRNNDVTIICGETGSGKSTQIPQMLYENGLTLAGDDANDKRHRMIGVTQPRRVAAVSTAKRVSYEMGTGNGRIIKGKPNGGGNLVAYHTRYETAGLGTATHVKFMTDGILLAEIQSDLLLRKYSVIVLDEAHERNLNTDVLIGLLSAAIPLRREAAEESRSDIVPLKIIVMSATLRVEDFTKSQKLFPTISPAVLKVPGRTHPVTIHHSKKTVLEKYEDETFKMVKKIHRKLPAGGILVFLTGKSEIIRMVKRLRRCLDRKGTQADDRGSPSIEDVTSKTAEGGNQAPRDLDDDEADADIFTEVHDDFDGLTSVDKEDYASEEETSQRSYVLPLYSLLPADEQAKVFQPPPDGHRLIVVATNIAETSITIPGISYVVDTGRQKCRNYNSSTGMASYDVMWISKASADQRAGRAGRTGPGHCYRLYSSSLYSRQMDDFALPEVLTRPLEDVVLAMKAMNISNVSDFPFATPPAQEQLTAAVRLLGNIGCVDLSDIERDGGDGRATKLGMAVAKLPLGVRYGKMLLVAAQAGVLDYAIGLVAALSESNPFVHNAQNDTLDSDVDSEDEEDNDKKPHRSGKWKHKGGDALAMTLAVGAYTFAGRGAGGVSETVACRKFCDQNGLQPTIMQRIQKMRKHLARLSMTRFAQAPGVASKTGGFLSAMKPPNALQESLLRQSVCSGLLDNVAILAPLGSISGEHPYSLRSAYISCTLSSREPLFMDRNSALYSRDSRTLPQWVCYETLQRKTHKDGTPVSVMKNMTPIDPAWLGLLAKGSQLLHLGDPIPSPPPVYDPEKDAMRCSVLTKYGQHGWEVPPSRADNMYEALHAKGVVKSLHFRADDSFRWFARCLLEGKVLVELGELTPLLNDSPAVFTGRAPMAKVSTMVGQLSTADVDSASALIEHWQNHDDKFLFRELKRWIKNENCTQAKQIWIATVKKYLREQPSSCT